METQPDATPDFGPEEHHSWNPWPLRTWLIMVAIMGPLLVMGIWIDVAADRQTPINPATEQIARSLAGAEIQVFRGSAHTVYQSMGALPSAANPRSDGRPTLVWFTTTKCGTCQQMDPYVYPTLESYASRLIFAEKAIDRSSDAARHGVTTAPTFVLLDSSGTEAGRFGFEPTAAALKAAIDALLKKAAS